MARRLPRHPLPPPDLRGRDLPLARWVKPLWRIHSAKRAAVHFGKSGDSRFDDPEHKFGVLYASDTWLGAFIETAGHRTGVRIVTRTWLEDRAVTQIAVSRALHLVDLRGRGLPRLGIDARITAGEHAPAQRWSRALWLHPSKPDGLCYCSRHDSSRTSVALFDRVEKSLRTKPLGCLANRAMEARVSEALDHYDFGLIL